MLYGRGVLEEGGGGALAAPGPLAWADLAAALSAMRPLCLAFFLNTLPAVLFSMARQLLQQKAARAAGTPALGGASSDAANVSSKGPGRGAAPTNRVPGAMPAAQAVPAGALDPSSCTAAAREEAQTAPQQCATTAAAGSGSSSGGGGGGGSHLTPPAAAAGVRRYALAQLQPRSIALKPGKPACPGPALHLDPVLLGCACAAAVAVASG